MQKCEFKMILILPANKLFTNTLASDLLLEHNIFYFVLNLEKKYSLRLFSRHFNHIITMKI